MNVNRKKLQNIVRRCTVRFTYIFACTPFILTSTLLSTQTLGKTHTEDIYEILGAYGIVKKCERKKDKTTFAIKVVLYKDAKLLNDIKREVSMMRRLKHDHLVTLYEAYECAGSFGMVMDYIAGGELFERIIEKEYLEEKEAVEYLHQLLEGLQHMHSKNIVHLDIKPENILCVDTKSNRIKLIDFGLARELKPGEVTRCALGTPDFVAPEAISFNEIKHQTDMWSTGVLTYVLLSGLMPFGGETDQETLCNISNVDWEFDEDSFEEISSDARDFIEKLLTLKPDDRLSSTDALGHPWMKANANRAGKINTKRHRTFLARRRWKKSVHVVIAVTKLCRLLQISTSVRSGSDTQVQLDETPGLDSKPKPSSNPCAGSNSSASDLNINPEIKPSINEESNANENALATTVTETSKQPEVIVCLDASGFTNGGGSSDSSSAKTPMLTQSGKNQEQNAPDDKLVRNLSFSSQNENSQKVMWKVLK